MYGPLVQDTLRSQSDKYRVVPRIQFAPAAMTPDCSRGVFNAIGLSEEMKAGAFTFWKGD